MAFKEYFFNSQRPDTPFHLCFSDCSALGLRFFHFKFICIFACIIDEFISANSFWYLTKKQQVGSRGLKASYKLQWHIPIQKHHRTRPKYNFNAQKYR